MKPQRTTDYNGSSGPTSTSLNSFSSASLAMDGWSRPWTKSPPTAKTKWKGAESRSFGTPLKKLTGSLSGLAVTPIKLTLGAVAVATLFLTFAIQRIPGAERIEVPKPTIQEAQTNAAWADNFQQAVAKKQDRVRQIEINRVSTEPVPITTERVRPDPAPSVPALVALPQDAEGENGPEPKYARRHHRSASAESNVCTRHHMRKVETRGGRSWRCKR
jgi:hypothetical protein